jgi:hypothetical protein
VGFRRVHILPSSPALIIDQGNYELGSKTIVVKRDIRLEVNNAEYVNISADFGLSQDSEPPFGKAVFELEKGSILKIERNFMLVYTDVQQAASSLQSSRMGVFFKVAQPGATLQITGCILECGSVVPLYKPFIYQSDGEVLLINVSFRNLDIPDYGYSAVLILGGILSFVASSGVGKFENITTHKSLIVAKFNSSTASSLGVRLECVSVKNITCKNAGVNGAFLNMEDGITKRINYLEIVQVYFADIGYGSNGQGGVGGNNGGVLYLDSSTVTNTSEDLAFSIVSSTFTNSLARRGGAIRARHICVCE